MKTYSTLTEALRDLKLRGFTLDFNLKDSVLSYQRTGVSLSPDEFEIVEVYHFDGITDVDDEVVLYAIASKHEVKGTLVNAYGAYSDSVSDALIDKLRFHK